MKKFSIAAVAALSLATAAPAFADTKTSDDPFVSTQGGGALAGWPGVLAAIAVGVGIIVTAGDT